MKKTGFTLAEVLITLAIIGVVATMTLPTLMTNTNEQQSKTGFKKVINTLSVVPESNLANYGYDYSTISSTNSATDNAEDAITMFNMFKNNAMIDLSRTGTGVTANGNSTSNFVIFFRDGSSLEFPNGASTNVGQAELGMKAVVDINGAKKPNILSNCQSNVNPFVGGTTNFTSETDAADCGTKSSRVIRDKFSVVLTGQYAIPNGAAARWAYNE